MSSNQSEFENYSFTIKGKAFSIPILNSLIVSKEAQGKDEQIVRETRPVILDVGQDQLTKKACYLSGELEKLGVHTVFFAGDRFGLGKENVEKDKLDWIPMENRSLQDWKAFRSAVRRYKPAHIELFLGMKVIDIAYYLLYAKLKGIPVVVRCRGGELRHWLKHRLHRKAVISLAIRTADLVLLRELFMPRYLVSYGIAPLKNCLLFHNHVPVPAPATEKREAAILFLNSLNPMRNPMRMLDIAELLIQRQIPFKFLVVGLTDQKMKSHGVSEMEKRFLEELEKRGLTDWFELHTFTNQTEQFYKRACVFLLPTDAVFCNHALLESMSYECVPLIEGGDGGEMIVDDGVSGFLIKGTVEEYADKIQTLLCDPCLREQMGRAARDKVLRSYDSEKQAHILLDYYCNNLWQ